MKYLKLLIFLPLMILSGCAKEPPYNPIPDVYVYKQIQTNDPRYTSLNMLGGHVYLDDVGYRGIIVIRDFEERLFAVDRACPYHPNESCARITVDQSGIYLRCGEYVTPDEFQACCTSRFYPSGDILEGPAQYPLKWYRTEQFGALITITSD